MDTLPNFFSVCVKFIFASAAHHTIVMLPGGESSELKDVLQSGVNWLQRGVVRCRGISRKAGGLILGIYKEA